MAKKDKKSKKARDDSWEDEIGEPVPAAPQSDAAAAAAAAAAAPAPAPVPAPVVAQEPKGPAAPAEATEDDFGPGGGLLGAIKKNQANKKKKGKKTAAPAAPVAAATADDDDGDATPDGSGTPVVADSALLGRAPTEISEIDDDDFGPVKKGKAGKPPLPAPAPATPNNEDAEHEDDAGAGRVKTKKEKEKEKKEKEKLRKKALVCPPVLPLLIGQI